MASAATAVAEGHYGIRVSPPHLGEDFDSLAQAFNQMAAQLQAYTEAIEDGVRSLTPGTTAMLRDQIQRLVRFTDDVAALAQAEESSTPLAFANIDVAELIAKSAAAVSERYRRKQVSLSTQLASSQLPPLWGDDQRLAQVLANLLDNALRQHHRTGGSTCTLTPMGANSCCASPTPGEGIAAEHLPHVFERLYRAASSSGVPPPQRPRVSGSATSSGTAAHTSTNSACSLSRS